MRRVLAMVASSALLAPLYVSCASCGDSGGGVPDAGTGTDTDVDSDADTDTDTSTWTSDAGPWEWEDNPPGEDCGPGCTQLTFTEEVVPINWDIWDKYLVYSAGTTMGKNVLYVVDIEENQRMKIPQMFPQFPSTNGSSAVLYPAIFEKEFCYSQIVFNSTPMTRNLIACDIEGHFQTILYSNEREPDEPFEAMKYVDIYGDHIVSQAGCGTAAVNGHSLCLFDATAVPAGLQTLIDDDYGNWNSIWKDVLVFTDARPGNFDITGYDLSTQEFVSVTSDEEYTQAAARINNRKIAYFDLRFGTNQDAVMGDLNHAAVFVYNLDTQEPTQITSGEWIAIEPDIWNEIVIWQDYRDAAQPNDVHNFYNVQVWGYNLETEEEFQVTNLPEEAWPTRPKANPRIWGYRVFVDMATEASETTNAIYMFDLPDGAR